MSDAEDSAAELAPVVMEVLDGWGVAAADQVRLLGLPAGTRPRALARHRKGQPLPEDPAVAARIRLILRIDRALRGMFPHNQILSRYWITTPQAIYGERTPLTVMLEDPAAMESIAQHLEGRREWY